MMEMQKAEGRRQKEGAGRRAQGAALRCGRRHPASCILRPAPRRGISLLEVLISIGIVAIGLVSIAALIPVGGIQAMRADIEQRKAETGLSAFQEFKTRGMARLPTSSQLNEATDPNTYCPWRLFNGNPYFIETGGVPPWFPDYSAYTPTPPPYLPVAIDPLMVAEAGGGGASTIKTFPANYGAAPFMPRLTLSTALTPELADAIFRGTDDMVIFQPSDAQMPSLSYDPSLATPPPKQDSAGVFSWAATLAPYYPDPETPAAGMHCTLSVVVFYRRSLPNPTAFNASAVREGTAEVSPTPAVGADDYVGQGGGDVKLTVPTPAGPYDSSKPNPLSYARPGNWLMLVRAAAGNRPAAYNWYRVVAGDVIDETSQKPDAIVTLAGPDWVFAGTASPQQTYAFLFDDVVAVYQRTIQLEGPSTWSP